jgi:glycosyltransferase involved in cell wall biosynthesis
MTIAIDARNIGTSTGVYVENLLNHLEDIDRDNNYVVILAEKSAGLWKPSKPNFRVVTSPYKNYTFGEQVGFAWQLYKLRPDLVHFCMPQQPLLYFGKRVTTVHDIILVRFENIDMNPVAYKVRKWIFIALLKNVIWRSKAVLVPTEYVRRDVLDFSSDKYSDKVVKTLEAGEPLADKPEPVAGAEGKQYIFFVGNAFPYKNLRTTVDAFALLQEKLPDLHLFLAGKKEFFYEQIEKYAQEKGVAKRTHFLGYISEGEKRWMFQNAEAYVVASLSEGFHIPGLEAMYEDCPVISSDASCLPEVYGDAAYYFDPHKPEGLAKAIEEVVTDEKLPKKLVEEGRKRVKKFSWRKMAEQTFDAYKQVLGSDKQT